MPLVPFTSDEHQPDKPQIIWFPTSSLGHVYFMWPCEKLVQPTEDRESHGWKSALISSNFIRRREPDQDSTLPGLHETEEHIDAVISSAPESLAGILEG